MTCHQGRQSKISVEKKITDFAVTDVDVVVEPIPAVDAAGAPVLDADGKPTTVKFTFPNVHYFAAGGTLYGSQVKMVATISTALKLRLKLAPNAMQTLQALKI